MNDSNQDQPFLKRWARLKKETKQKQTAEASTLNTSLNTFSEAEETATTVPATGLSIETAQTPIATDDNAANHDVIDESPTIELTDADMPPIESLNEDSDYRGFLSSGVSEALRKQALRKLFSGAVFNERDGLDDYDDDYSLSQYAPLGDIVTSDMKHQIEVEARRELEKSLQASLEADNDTVANTIIETPNDDRDTLTGTMDNTTTHDTIATPNDDADSIADTIDDIDITPTPDKPPLSQTSDTQ